MPIVTIDPGNYERFELKSAPANPSDPNDENGYVMLRPLPYGMKLSRRSKATKMMMRSQPQARGGGKSTQQAENVFEVESMDEWAVAFDFQYCIGDHNLQDSKGNKIDFATNTHMKIKMLDPRVGTEIEMLIDNLNNAEDEESLEDFLKRSSTSFGEETNLSDTAGNESGAQQKTEPQPG